MRMVHSTVGGYTTRQSEWSACQWYPNSRSMLPNQRNHLFCLSAVPYPTFPLLVQLPLVPTHLMHHCYQPLIIPLAITSFTVYTFYPEVFLGGPWINFHCTHPTRERCEYSLFMAPIPLATIWVQVYGIHQPVYSKPLLHSCTLKPIPCKCSARQLSGWCHYWIAIAKTCYTYAWAPQDSGTGDPWAVCLSHSVLACARVLGMQGMVIKDICIEE